MRRRWLKAVSVLAIAVVLTACGAGPERDPAVSGSTPARDGGVAGDGPAVLELTPDPGEDQAPESSDDWLAHATPTVLDEAARGSLEQGSAPDVFVFDAKVGESYQVDVALGTLTDSTVALFNADGRELAYNDDYADSLASRLRWKAENTGPLYVAVNGYDGSAGSYTLTVLRSKDPGDSLDDSTPIILGEPIGGSIDQDFDKDFFVFEASAGEVYQVNVSLETLSDSEVALYDPDGNLLASNDDYEDSFASRLYWKADRTRPLHIAVSGYGYRIGSYILTVALANDDHGNSVENATLAEIGQPLQGVIEHESDSDYFIFDAEAGKDYVAHVSSGTLSTSMTALYDADGLPWNSQSIGRLYAVVQGADGDTGSYTLTIFEDDDDHGDTLADATALTGESTPGSLLHGDDVDFFVFTAQAGDVYEIDVSLGTLSDSTAALYDASGEQLAYNDDYDETADSLETRASRLYWRTLDDGPLYVAVGSYEDQTGTYILSVREVSDDHGDSIDDPTLTMLNELRPGSIDYRSDIDYFAFDAQEGQIYEAEVFLETLSDSVATLYDVRGNMLAFNDDYDGSSASVLHWRADSDARVYLAVEGYENTTGTYNIRITDVDLAPPSSIEDTSVNLAFALYKHSPDC